MKQARKRRLYIIGAISAALASLFIVAASPFALSPLASLGPNWTLLSNIGQTYGAISALLAAIGISGVVTTIIFQIRESRQSRADAIRSHHYNLYRIAMEDSSLAETSHLISRLPSHKVRKQTIYINLQLEFWLMLWEINNLSEDTLRGYAADLLRTESGQDYWRRFGMPRARLKTGSRGEDRFLQVINDEYLRLPKSRQAKSSQTENESRTRIATSIVTGVVITLAAGVALVRAIKLQGCESKPPRARS